MENKDIKVIKKQLGMYVIYDKLAGIFTLPIIKHNNIIMIREFDYIVNSKKAFTEATDYQLFKVGEYNDIEGKIDPYEKMEFLKNGENIDPNKINNDLLQSLAEKGNK